nr:hypothetical protein H9T68_21395 [Delftia sp. PS-11]
MSFMPGDRKGGIPQSVEAEWILHSEEYSAWSKRTPDNEVYTKENQEIYQKLWAANPHYIQRVDLAPILTPELIEQVRADRKNTQLKMTVIYRDDKVEITASTYKWR